MQKLSVFSASLALGLGLAGCSPDPVDQTHSGQLTEDDPRVESDESAYDEYTFDAGEGWQVTVDMTSTDFDNYLWLIGPNREDLVQNDDGPNGLNAHISYVTTKSGTYTVRANSRFGPGYEREVYGSYQVHIVAAPMTGQ